MFTWVARYTDDSEFPQLDPVTGTMRAATTIDRSRLKSFTLVNSLEGGRVVLTQLLEPGQRFIYRRRVAVNSTGAQIVCHLVGWQRTLHGTNIQHISYVFENGEITNGSKFQGKGGWMAEIQEVPEDSHIVGEPVPTKT